MKVLHIAYVHSKSDNRIVYKECLSLAKNGYEVYYATGNYKEDDLIPDCINFIPLKEKNDSLMVNYFINRKLRGEYCSIIEHIKPQVIHIQEYGVSYLVKYIKKHYKNIKVVYDVHENNAYMNYEDEIKCYGKIVAKLLALLRRHKDRQACEHADLVVTATPHIQDLLESYSRKVVTVKNYPLLNSFSVQNVNEKKDIVCYVGTMAERRGISDIIEMSPQIKGTVYLAGPIKESYKKVLLDRYTATYQKNWFYEGVLNRDEVGEIYNKSRVGICTLKRTTNYYYSLPIKLFEYMEAGLPVVVSDFPLWREIVDDAKCGFCVDEEKKVEISEKVNYLLEHPDEAMKMGQSGRKAVLEKYNWGTEEKKLLKSYKEL